MYTIHFTLSYMLWFQSAKSKLKKAMPQKRSKSDAMQTFDPKQIQEFKEAFTVMDNNKDGIIDKSDLRDLYAMMGMLGIFDPLGSPQCLRLHFRSNSQRFHFGRNAQRGIGTAEFQCIFGIVR